MARQLLHTSKDKRREHEHSKITHRVNLDTTRSKGKAKRKDTHKAKPEINECGVEGVALPYKGDLITTQVIDQHNNSNEVKTVKRNKLHQSKDIIESENGLSNNDEGEMRQVYSNASKSHSEI